MDMMNDDEALEEKEPLVKTPEKPIKDWFYLTYFILFLHGIGHLLPWNMFITAHEYFSERFTCAPGTNTACYGFQDNFENFFSLAAMVPVMITTAINIYIQSKIHFKYRMFTSIIAMFFLFIITTVFVRINTEYWVDEFFGLTLLTIILMNIFSGLFQSSTFGFAGILPQEYTAAVMSGQAYAGLFSSVARIISSVVTEDVLLSALIYFLSAVIVILLCFISLFVLLRLPFVKHYMKLTSVRAIRARQESIIRSTVNVKAIPNIPFCAIFLSISVYAFSVFMVFTVTISLFPAVISSIKSTVKYPSASIWTGKLFDALICFLMFNVSDFVGRYLSTWFKMVGKWKFVLLALTISRVVFIPMVMFCNAQGRSIPVLFTSDLWPILLTTCIGLSNGFFASLAMVSAPQ
jgi:equilibrative nucleoside transporter 1/2/3